MANADLQSLRLKIDALDRELLKLLNQRQSVSVEIGRHKQKEGILRHDPAREKALMEKLADQNPGPIPNDGLANIYREILSISLAAQAPISVGYLGPEASFSHEAALGRFGHSTNLVAQDSILEVFRGVDRDRFTYGVVPVENSSQGGVGQTLDLFLEFDLKVNLEIRLRISHNLMAMATDSDQIKKIISHPQVLSQTATWLATNLKGIPQFEVSSSSAAARMAVEEDGTAAVGSIIAADIYGLNILAKSIEDAQQNVTRFLVLSKETAKKTGQDKTSLILTVDDRPGALYGILEVFSLHGVNMSKIESRPKKDEAWKYNFFIDIEGHTDDDNVASVLEEVKKRSQRVMVLGSYPRVD